MIAVVVPSNRPERLQEFEDAWRPLFRRHGVTLVRVVDGDDPQCRISFSTDITYTCTTVPLSSTPEEWQSVVYNKNDGVRNFGFLQACKFNPRPDVILTLDDDVKPIPGTDPIQEHLDKLKERPVITWTTHYTPAPRGAPYGIRDGVEVWVSVGGWTKNPDYDAPTQLVFGNREGLSKPMCVHRGVFFPLCGMNVAFKTEALPYLYFAPMGEKVGVHRFGDIWMGLRLKAELDRLDKAIVLGYATIEHTRASNVFVNLEQEAKGIRWNETMWKLVRGNGFAGEDVDVEQSAYWRLWDDRYKQWNKIVTELLK